LLQYERQAWEQGYRRVAGIDEAGRGPLAGPVVAAAVLFDRDFLEREAGGCLVTLNDSKKLTPRKREYYCQLLLDSPMVDIGVGVADASEIDSLNILNATHAVMRRAVERLSVVPDHILVDGLPVPGFPVSSTAITKGDGKSLSIAAASVVAKVTRDRFMVEMDEKYPIYGFAKHKGYGTKTHMSALLEFGPCELHRRSFRPVRDAEDLMRRRSPDGD
jgi:ribonuclease HII